MVQGGSGRSETGPENLSAPLAVLPMNLPPFDKKELIELVQARALRRGRFTLASGKTSSYYLDCKQVTLHSRGALLVAQGMLEMLESPWPDAVGGMSIGADPITAALITAAGVQGRELLGFMVRKEPKGHGTQRYIEGPVTPGQRVVIVEDVITTGGSSLLAAERASQFGLQVTEVLAIVDRLEGGREAIQQAGYGCRSLLTITDLGIEPPQE